MEFLEAIICLKKAMEAKSDSDTNSNWCTWTIPKGVVKEVEELALMVEF